MARSGRNAVKVLMLTPLITMALALVMLLYWLAFVNEADTKGPMDAYTRQTELTEDTELPQQ